MRTLTHLSRSILNDELEFNSLRDTLIHIIQKTLGVDWTCDVYISSKGNTIRIYRTEQPFSEITINCNDNNYSLNFDDKDNLGENIFNKIKHLL